MLSRGAEVVEEVQLNMLIARDSSEAAFFTEQDRRMFARDKHAWQQLNASRCIHFPLPTTYFAMRRMFTT